MKSLNIPKRERLKGQTITCTKCRGKGYCSTKTSSNETKWVCKQTNKRLSTCSYPESQSYTSVLYNPLTKKSDILIKHSTRDFWTFRKKHIQLLNIEVEMKEHYKKGNIEHVIAILKNYKKIPKAFQKFKNKNSLAFVINEDTYLQTAMELYNLYINGKKGESWEKRPTSKKVIEGYRRTLEKFHKCLIEAGFQPATLRLSNIHEVHLKPWVSEVKKTYNSPYTQNHYLNDLSVFLNWCTRRGATGISNYLDHVERAKTKGDTTTVSIDDFKNMLQLITVQNGKSSESWIDSKTGKEQTKTKNHYREWLNSGFFLSLLLGGRGDDIADFKWNEVKTKTNKHGKKLYWIELFDHKYYRKYKVEKYDHITVYKQTYSILQSIGLDNKIGTSEYVIAPEIDKRSRVLRIMSESFRHYWRLYIGHHDSKISFKSLRSTNMTISSIVAGPNSDLIKKHTKSDTTRKHYIEKSMLVAEMFGDDFEIY